MAARAVPRASSSTSRPRAERMCEKPVGSSPRPPGTGACGRYPNEPRRRTLPRWRSCGDVSPTSTEMKDDFPVPLRPTRPTFSPAPTTKEASASSVRSPISMVRADPTITPHCTSANTRSIHSANARSRPQVVDPDRRLHGDLHAPARHHGRERGAARHPAVAARELLGPAVGRGRLLADAGRLPADRRRRGRHLRAARGLRGRSGHLLPLLAGVRALDDTPDAEPGPRRAGRRRRHHVRHLARPHRQPRSPGGTAAQPSASTARSSAAPSPSGRSSAAPSRAASAGAGSSSSTSRSASSP